MATIEKSNQTERQGQKTVTTIYIIFHKKGATLFFFFGAWQSANETATIGCSLIDW